MGSKRKEAYSQLAGEREKEKEGEAGRIEGGDRGRGKREGRKEENSFFSVIEVEQPTEQENICKPRI